MREFWECLPYLLAQGITVLWNRWDRLRGRGRYGL